MCGRYVLAGDPDGYAEYFGAGRILAEAIDPSYNVAPTDPVYVVAEWEGERVLTRMGWGFIPHWSRDRKQIHINARCETVGTKPLFRRALERRRCIVPADGFYEWEPKDRGRTPHWVYRADGFPMGFAGVWSTWKDPSSDELVRTCAIITGEAAAVVRPIHDRMPIALDSSVWDEWLDRDRTDAAHAARLLVPIPAELILEHPVSPRVNSVRNNQPDLTSPAEPETLF